VSVGGIILNLKLLLPRDHLETLSLINEEKEVMQLTDFAKETVNHRARA